MQRKHEIDMDLKDERSPSANSVSRQTRYNSARSKWSSPISGTLSDEALRMEQDKQEKSKRLEQRRSHLSSLLEDEKNQYQNELTSNRQSISELKIGENFQHSVREKEHPIISHLQLESWSEPHEYDREEQTGRQKRIEELKRILHQQMNEIKQKEKESELLKQEEDNLFQEQQQLERYEDQRKQIEKTHLRIDSSRPLLRQHKAKLHKRSKEIQEQLELNIQILQFLTKHTENDQRNASKLLQQFEEQMKLEKEKEQEFYGMFPDEATKQWSHHEQKWNLEKELREKLMNQLIDQRQRDIRERLDQIKEEQEDLNEKQQILIRDMEQARKYNLIEKEKQIKETEEKKLYLQKQILIEQQERKRSQLEFEKQRDLEHDYNKQLELLTQRQKSATNNSTTESKFYGRRRMNWN